MADLRHPYLARNLWPCTFVPASSFIQISLLGRRRRERGVRPPLDGQFRFTILSACRKLRAPQKHPARSMVNVAHPDRRVLAQRVALDRVEFETVTSNVSLTHLTQERVMKRALIGIASACAGGSVLAQPYGMGPMIGGYGSGGYGTGPGNDGRLWRVRHGARNDGRRLCQRGLCRP